jgi:hypothetical protein
MRSLLFGGIVLLLTTPCLAQTRPVYQEIYNPLDTVFPPATYALTPEEARLNGWSRLWRGLGAYWDRIGDYFIDREIARERAIENHGKAVREWWSLKNGYEARNQTENYLDYQERRLDTAERRYALIQREQSLIDAGVLPQKKKQSITIRGRTYNSVAEWKGTADHVLHKLEMEEKRLIGETLKLQEERCYREAVASQRWWNRLGIVGQHRYTTKRDAALLMGWEPPRPPHVEFSDIEIGMTAHFNVLDKVRKQQQEVRRFIAIHGNKKIGGG